MKNFIFKNKKKLFVLFGIIVGIILIYGIVCTIKLNSDDGSNSYTSSDHKEKNGNHDTNDLDNNLDISNNNTIDNENDDNKSTTSTNNNTSNSNNNTNNNNSNTNNNTNSNSNNNNTNSSNSSNNNNSYSNNNNKSTINATKEYYCTDTSYNLKNNKCYKTISMDSSYRFTCSEGTLNVNVCEGQSTILFTNYTEIAKELCMGYGGHYNSCVCTKSGGFVGTDGKCYKTINVKKNATKEYYCISSDYTLNKNDNKCYKTFELDAMYRYTCPEGYSQIGDKCESN